jgi:hypothetical protein
MLKWLVDLVPYFRERQTLREGEKRFLRRGPTAAETLELNDLHPFTPRPIDLQ